MNLINIILEFMNSTIIKTKFHGPGAEISGDSIRFSCVLHFLKKGGIRIYDRHTKKLLEDISLTPEDGVGDVFLVEAEGLPKGILYRLYEDDREFPDPYSKKIVGNEIFGEGVSGEDLYSAVTEELSMEGDCNPDLSFSDTITYLCHVRGLTMMDKACHSKGTFSGLAEKIPYFQELGVNQLMLMPAYEFIECGKDKDTVHYKDDPENPRVNYWGFCKSFYFSLKAGFAKDDANVEFRDLVLKLHAAGMELVMMMYYPFETEPSIIRDSLHYYVENFHVDGFRLMGPKVRPEELVEDPFLSRTKLYFENTDPAPFSGKKKAYKNVGLIQNIYMDSARAFLKGDEDKAGFMSYALRENHAGFAPVRFITDYNGFTLNDLVSYSRKHNEANGEDNADGTSYNYSWNCGFEGQTRKPAVCKLRVRQAQNAMLLNLLGQGTPMLLAGDEVLNTASGNNNPWCQDNETGWVLPPKTKMAREFYQFTKNLIAFRKRHVILHQPQELKLVDYMSCKLPDISFHGEEAYRMNLDPVSREFAVLLAGDYAKQYKKEAEDSLYLVFNMHWEERTFPLPVKDKDTEYRLLFSTDGSTDISFDEDKAVLYEKDSYVAKGRTISLFLVRKKK